MAKKSKKRHTTHGREYPGCVPSLLNIFDFRRGRSTIRGLPDRRPRPSNTSTEGRLSIGNGTVAVGCDEVFESNEDPEEKERSMSENAKVSVKEILKVGVISEADVVNLPSNSEVGANCLVETKAFDKLVYETVVEHLVGISDETSLENDFFKCLDMLSAQAITITDQKLVAAVKLLLEDNVLNARKYESPSPGDSMVAVNMLTENYTSLVELLQELHSFWLKRALPCPQASNLPHRKPGNTKNDEYSSHKHQGFFRSRSLESFLQESAECNSSLAMLGPSSVVTQNLKTDASVNGASFLSSYMYDKQKNERCKSFRFSFTEIKRRLWQVLGRDQTVISSVYSSKSQKRKNTGKQKNLDWNSSNRNHLYSERYILSTGQNGEQNIQLKESGNDTARCQGHGIWSIYIEAKKHICEMLKDVNEEPDPIIKKLAKSSVTILTAPDPAVDEVLGSMPSRTDGDDCDVDVRSTESQSAVPHRGNGRTFALEIQFSYPEYAIPQEITEAAESGYEEAGKITEAKYESYTSSMDGDFQHEDIREDTCADTVHQTYLKSELIEKDQIFFSPTVSNSHSPATHEAKGFMSERPSPVSVFESLFMDDTSSSASIASEPVREMKPDHLNFEEQYPSYDQGSCMRISMENEESPFEYVEAVLLGSGLDWDDFHLRWLSSHEILDSSLFDEVEIFSNRSRHDQHLLFDCANEALMGVCDIYFGKEFIQPLPDSMYLIDEIWRWIEWHLILHTQSNSMDRLVQMDLARSGKWMNLHRDIKLISFEIQIIILDELMEETTLSFLEVSSENELVESVTTLDDDKPVFGSDSSSTK